MKRFGKAENERLMAVSAFLILPLLIGGITYLVYLRSINVIKSETDFVLHIFYVILPCVITCFGTYEVLYSRKIKKVFLFHFKRFLVHTVVFASYWVTAIALWFALQSLISWKYSLILSGFVALLVLVIIIRIPRITNALNKIDEGEQ